MQLATCMQASGSAPSRGIRRSVVAKRLGVSIATVRALETRGLLHPWRDDDGWSVRFSAEEVARLAETYRPKSYRPRTVNPAQTVNGETAARVFDAIARGLSFEQVVIETRVVPDIVRKLWAEYSRGPDPGAELREKREREERRAQREAEKAQARADKENAEFWRREQERLNSRAQARKLGGQP